MSDITVDEVLHAFSPAFKSIDFRIVAVKPEVYWISAITSMFISCKSQKEIKSEQQKIKEKLPKSDKFSILLDCYPFDSISDLFKQIENEEIEIDGNSIKFQQVDSSKLKIDTYLPSYLKAMKEWKLIGSVADTQLYDEIWEIMANQNGPSRLVGYENIYDLIRETLKIRNFNRGRPRALVIGIPIPARIVDISFNRESVKIKTKKAFSLDDLQLNISVNRVNHRSSNFEPFWRTTELVKKCKHPLKRGFCYVMNSIKLANSKPHDRIEVELIHRKVPTLSMDRTFLEVPLENAVEPFAKALGAFCSLDLFRERLLSPEKFKKSGVVFENAVAWLLSLIGFSVTQLREEFETLRIPETKFEEGSIDMIAYRENEHLLFVDCDTKIPDDKKIRSMVLVREYFKSLQDKQGRPYLLSVIFSPRNCTGIQTDSLTMRIIDRNGIKRIFEEAMKGDTGQARSALVYW